MKGNDRDTQQVEVKHSKQSNQHTTLNICNAGVMFCGYKCVNDPSAGSPTETLLRLLLPRNVQI